MFRIQRCVSAALVATLTAPSLLLAQFPSAVVGFNGPPIGDPATSQEMFRTPEVSGTTAIYIVPNTPGEFDFNAAFRASGLQTEGAASMRVFFKWVDVADPDAWVRLTTFDGVDRPNPSLDTRGKVRFKFNNLSELFAGGEVGLCLGIRETGIDVPQLADGGTSGPIEWVGVDTTVNGIIAGSDGIVDTTAEGDDVQEYPVGFDIIGAGLPSGTAVVSPGTDGDIDTTPDGDDEDRFGYFIGTNGERVPIPAVTIPTAPSAVAVQWNLATGNVTVGGVSRGGGIAGFTGDGVLNPPNHRGTLEHVVITNVVTDTADDIDFGIDELQFEATVPDPVLPPRIVSPIIAGDQQVTVTDLMPSVNRVSLFVNDGLLEDRDVSTPADVVFDIAAAVADDVYTAKQRDSVTGMTSAASLPVTVLAEPPPYTFSILVDETGGGSCTIDEWEWVGVTSLPSPWAPQGQPLFTSDSVWQAIDVPLDDDGLVIGGLGGDGSLLDSPSGFYTIDSIWFTISSAAVPGDEGPWEVFVDAIQLVGSNGMVGETILDMEDGVNRLKFSRGQSSTLPTSSDLSDVTSYDGLTSHRLLWTYPSTDPDEALGMLQRIEFQCGTSALIDDSSQAVRFHLLTRGQPTAPTIPLPEVVGPIIVGTQDTVRVNNAAGAMEVQLFINGVAAGSAVTPTGTETDITGLSMEPGDSISATQTVDAGTSGFAFPRVVLSKPPPPTVVSPVFPGGRNVSVTDLLVVPHATAEFVAVYVNGAFAGSDFAGTETVDVELIFLPGVLETGDVVTATQFVNEAEESDHSDPVIVGVPAPTLYKAPAAGETSVTVVDVNTNASAVNVFVGGSLAGSVDPAGESSVDVTVAELGIGQIVTANMIVGGAESGLTDPETVTTNVTTQIVCDDFEYVDQAAFEDVWTATAGDVPQVLSTDTQTTPGGEKSLYASAAVQSRVEIDFDATTNGAVPTPTRPVVVTASIYDPAGGGPGNQWVDAIGDLVVGDFFLLEVGMASCCAPSTTYYNLRLIGNGGPNWVDLDEFDAPARSVGWHVFTVVHKGDFVDAYVDGLLARKNIPLTEPTTIEISRIGSGLVAGNEAYYDDYCLTFGPARFPGISEQPPLPPTVRSPIEDGDATVTVDDVDTNATLVEVFAGGTTLIGSVDPLGAMDGVIVPVTPLVHLQSITATQTSPTGTSDESQPLEVGKGNGDLLICIGIRETGDVGPLGSEGGTTGDIEWIGAGSAASGAPQGLAISPSNDWQTLVFDPAAGLITGFTGDGTVDGARGTLEHLAVAVNAASADRSTGAFVLYVDDVVNVGAGAGGGDFVITDFEGSAIGDEVLFQEPTFSGTTDFHLSFPPSASETSDVYANGGAQSQLLTWFFRDTTEQRWARITTSDATGGVSRPIIDLTRPIRMEVLLLAGCPTVAGDMDGDCDIDLDDLALFEGCLLGPASSAGPECVCGDFNGNGRVDLRDFGPFQIDFTDGDPVPGCTP